MGIPVVVVGKQHVCPMKDGKKEHKGGAVTEGISGVFVDGIPVATVGSACACCSPKTNSITSGAAGVLVDGKPIAILGSQTEHGGNLIEGVPGVSVSGSFPTRSDTPEDFEPRVFNLQWKKEDKLTNFGKQEELVVLSADTVGYKEGETVKIEIYKENDAETIDVVEGIVKDGRIEVEWVVNYNKKEEDARSK